MASGDSTTARGRLLRAAALGCVALAGGGCVVTFDNDAEALGGNDDRWYTSGWRLQHDLPADVPDSERPWYDAGTLAVAGHLQLIPDGTDDGQTHFTTVSLVGGQQIFTPENIEVKTPIKDDRPYAGWLYAGVVRYDTWLDPDALRRHDIQHAVELDLGIVGPSAFAEQTQSVVHSFLGNEKSEGWDNQLGDEIGLVLRASRSAREAYAGGLTDGGLAFDAISTVGGALGNVDTHAGVGGTLRLGWNLPRSFDVQSGDRQRLLPGGARVAEEPASIFLFTGVDGRVVLHNIFLDGNTFRESASIGKEPLVGAFSVGFAWEWSDFRAAYTRTQLTHEFDGQPDDEVYGSLTLGWSHAF